MSRLPDRAIVVEVGPRDGLQSQAGLLSLDAKLGFIERLNATLSLIHI